MNREKFREIHDLLMEQLDVSRELSDEEILEVIDELILNQSKELFFSLKEKVGLRQELFCSVRKLDVLKNLVLCMYRYRRKKRKIPEKRQSRKKN